MLPGLGEGAGRFRLQIWILHAKLYVLTAEKGWVQGFGEDPQGEP